jgi:hypothetical protein
MFTSDDELFTVITLDLFGWLLKVVCVFCHSRNPFRLWVCLGGASHFVSNHLVSPKSEAKALRNGSQTLECSCANLIMSKASFFLKLGECLSSMESFCIYPFFRSLVTVKGTPPTAWAWVES